MHTVLKSMYNCIAGFVDEILMKIDRKDLLFAVIADITSEQKNCTFAENYALHT